MADAEKQLVPVGDGADGAPKKKSKLKLIIILAAALVVLGGGGFAAWKFFLHDIILGKPSAPVASSAGAAAPEASAAKPVEEGKPAPPVLAPAPALPLTLDPFMVNLADTNARRFLRIIVAIDVESEAMKAEVEARMPRIRDSLLLLFGSKTSYDLSGPQGKLRLRMEILKTINNVLGVPNKITQAFYMEFVVQ